MARPAFHRLIRVSSTKGRHLLHDISSHSNPLEEEEGIVIGNPIPLGLQYWEDWGQGNIYSPGPY